MIKKHHLELVISQPEPIDPSLSPIERDFSLLEGGATEDYATVHDFFWHRGQNIRDKLGEASLFAAHPELSTTTSKERESQVDFLPDIEAELSMLRQEIARVIAPRSDVLADMQQGALNFIESLYLRNSIQEKDREEQFAFFKHYVDPLIKRIYLLGEMDDNDLQREAALIYDMNTAEFDNQTSSAEGGRVIVVDFRASRTPVE